MQCLLRLNQQERPAEEDAGALLAEWLRVGPAVPQTYDILLDRFLKLRAPTEEERAGR